MAAGHGFGRQLIGIHTTNGDFCFLIAFSTAGFYTILGKNLFHTLHTFPAPLAGFFLFTNQCSEG